MRTILMMAAMLLLSAGLSAQTSFDEVRADLNKAGGVYYAYPEPTSSLTPAPKGYVPFYISHYARHGSRYLLGDRDYKWIIDVMSQADSCRVLTTLGRDVLTRLDRLWPYVQGRGGDLTPVGVNQHKRIAERMFRNFPEVFKGKKIISARSTIVPRCAMSMVACGDELKSLAPQLSINYEMSGKYMDYLNYHTAESNEFTDGNNGPWVGEYKKFEAEHVNPHRLISTLFNDEEYTRRHFDAASLMWGLYWIAVDMQDMNTDISFYDIFEPRELFDLWQCVNYRFYVGNANHKDGNGIVVANSRNLLRNIIYSADEAIKCGDVAATLRFGHDGNVIPLLAILHIENYDVSVSKPEEVYKVWSDFKAAPMAANIQLVFYKNREGDILVKFLHNEREVHIPVKTNIFPYYHWKEVREYYINEIK
jgi:hypothetical protein